MICIRRTWGNDEKETQNIIYDNVLAAMGHTPMIRLNQNIYSDIFIVTDEEALQTSRNLARKEGILCGISSGTNVAAALALAKKLGPGKTVVTILPDTAERYFSTPLFEG